jgi:hypothetical protein
VHATDERTSVVLTDTTWLGMIRVPDYRPPTWPGGDTPKHIHLDPAGHPFCLTANIPFSPGE